MNSTTALSNRGIDFTNRGADLNPNDIEAITILKGVEASALYGIDAANGAILITTKRGRSGAGVEYSNSIRMERTRATPTLQRVYGPTSIDAGGVLSAQTYFGTPYPAGTQFYDNIGGIGYDTLNLIGMQADSSRANFFNKNGYPLETRPRDGSRSRGTRPGSSRAWPEWCAS